MFAHFIQADSKDPTASLFDGGSHLVEMRASCGLSVGH
jgi:hypothetical protein